MKAFIAALLAYFRPDVDKALSGLHKAIADLEDAKDFHQAQVLKHAEIVEKAEADLALHSDAASKAFTVAGKLKDLVSA